MSRSKPYPTDSYPTETSRHQAETEEILLANYENPQSQLRKNAHMQYLVRNLLQGFPVRYTSQDASQPWLMYWTLHALALLGVDLDPDNKQMYDDLLPNMKASQRLTFL